MAATRMKALALRVIGSAAGADPKGAAPPRHSAQCPPLPDGFAGALWPESIDCCTPDAEHTWCKPASAGLAARSGVMTAADSESNHQANTPAATARAWRKRWNREAVLVMLTIGSADILPR